MNKRVGLGIAGLALVAAVWFVWNGDRDVRRINSKLDDLVELLEKREEHPPLRMMARSRRVAGFFTPDAEVLLAPVVTRTVGPDELTALHHYAHTQAARLSVRISDRTLEINPERDAAVMRFTTRSQFTGHQGQREQRVDEFRLHWAKRDGDWLIQEAATIPAIRPPRPAS